MKEITKLRMIAWNMERAPVKPNLYRDVAETAFAVFKGLYNAFKGPIERFALAARTLPLRWMVGLAFLSLIALADEPPVCEAVYGAQMVVVKGFFKGCVGQAKDLTGSNQVYFDALKCVNGTRTYNQYIPCEFLRVVKQ